MYGRSFKLFTLFGIEIRLNVSWVFIAMLLSWALSQGYFPTVYEGLSPATYWWMGIVAVFGLFFSILLHELAHSVVAQAFGMEIKSITLWLLGGVAEMTDEPPHPRAEFLMALAGPMMSVLLAVFFFLMNSVLPEGEGAVPLGAVVQYLSLLNMILAAFNLVPAYPLDGGRVARAALWAWTGDYYRATSDAARMGSVFGLFLVIFGIVSALGGAGFAALWWVILGMFIRFAAEASRVQLESVHALQGKRVDECMTRNPTVVDPNISVAALIEDWIYRYSYEFFPVVSDGDLLGSVSLAQVRNVASDDRQQTRVGDIMLPCSQDSMISPSAMAVDALKKVQQSKGGLLMVVEKGRLVGVVGLKDLMRIIAVRSDLGL